MRPGHASVDRLASPPSANAPAFVDSLFEVHAESVWRFLRRLGVPEASVDDAVQDVFMVVHKRAGDYRGTSAPRTWIFGIALNVTRQYRRSWRRFMGLIAGLSARDRPSPLGSVVDDAPAPDEVVARRQAAFRLARILKRMKAAPRTVFVLVEIEGFSLTEAARMLDVSLTTASSRLSVARALFEREIARLARLDEREVLR